MSRNVQRRKTERYSLFLEKENAVSPVVGVMLMLVVTIIIAAVVAAFASGLGTTTTTTPVASYEFTIHASKSLATDTYPVTLKVLAGDSIDTNDLQMIISYTVPKTYHGSELMNAGKVIIHTIDGSIDPITANNLKTTVEGYPFTHQTTAYSYALYPYTGGFKQSSFFGKTTFVPGKSYYINQPLYFFGFDIYDSTAYGFDEGATVHITIVHTPSGKTIYDKDVMAEW